MLISTINNISLMLCSRIHSRDIVCYQEADVRSHFIYGRVTRFPGFLTVIGNSFLNLIQNGWSRVEIKRKKLKRMTQKKCLCLETLDNLSCNLLIVWTLESENFTVFAQLWSKYVNLNRMNTIWMNKSIYNKKFFH